MELKTKVDDDIFPPRVIMILDTIWHIRINYLDEKLIVVSEKIMSLDLVQAVHRCGLNDGLLK